MTSVVISAILSAAGLSQRMGQVNKLLLPWKGRAMVAHLAEVLLDSAIHELVVVLGHQARAVEALLPQSEPKTRLKTVMNADFARGLTSSIQTGIRAANTESTGYLICLGDQPHVTPDLINRLIEHFETGPDKAIAAPVYRGHRGTPVLFSAHWRQAILAETYSNGCRNLIAANPQVFTPLTIDEPWLFDDIDTPDDYLSATKIGESRKNKNVE